MRYFQPLIPVPRAARAAPHPGLPVFQLCTFLQWETAPSGPPSQASRSVTSCREPAGSADPPQWSCRWLVHRLCQSSETSCALQNTFQYVCKCVKKKKKRNALLAALKTLPFTSECVQYKRIKTSLILSYLLKQRNTLQHHQNLQPRRS